MMTASRYTVRAHDAASTPLAEHVLRADALEAHARAHGCATIFDDSTGLPAEGLEEMEPATPATPADVDAWITEQHKAALAHREQCVAALAALRAEIAAVEATIARLDVLIHGPVRQDVPVRRPERGTLQERVRAHLAAHPRCPAKALALAIYSRNDERTIRRVRFVIHALSVAGKVRNVGCGQWEVV